MRARGTDMESVDAIDPIASEEMALAGSTAAISDEVMAPTTALDPYPNQGIVASSAGKIADGGTLDDVYASGGVFVSDLLWHVDAGNVATLDVDMLPPVYGTSGNDVIYGNHLLRDVIFGRGGDDILYGGDEIGPGDRIEGGTGNDVIHGQFGEDYLRGDEGNDQVYGGASNDTIYGNEGADLLWGDDGNDKISGMTGSDTVHGGAGDDYISLSGYDGYDTGDVAFGDAGNDIIYGSEGVDHLYGGDGKDKIISGSHVDYLDGGDGDDTLEAGYGNDMLWGRAGNDTMKGESGYDLLYAGAGDDIVYGDDINPLSQFGEADTLHGEEGEDRLIGNGGNDYLYGGAQDDWLIGGVGDDVLDGGTGSDRLTGGAGRDSFVLADRPFQGGYYNELDVITDFAVHGPAGNDFLGDIVDLRQIFDQHTTFTGTNADQAWAQGYLYFVEHEFGTKVYIDPNGNAPDPESYYGQHYDFVVADLQGVAHSELGAIGGEFFGLRYNFLV